MSSGRQVTFFTVLKGGCCGLVGILLMLSCTAPKKFQPNKPFVYKTRIELNGAPAGEKQVITEKLQNQLDDSLKTRIISYAGVYRVLLKPPVFDTLNIGRSRLFMASLLNSMGYFNPSITDTFHIDTVGRQYRVYVDFKVTPGRALRMDSIRYELETPEFQSLALKNRAASFLKKGDTYSDQKVLAELDRLLELYRDNGYYKVSREDIYAQRDTVVAALIDPSLDPFEQALLLDSLRKKRINPTINVMIKQRPPNDSSHLMKYYIGDITVYPDLDILEDSSSLLKKDSAVVKGYKFLYSSNRFKLNFIANNIVLRPGTLYSQRRYFRTINTFNQLGAWQNVNLDLTERLDSVPLLDATLKLFPAKKLSLSNDLEVSRNVSDFLTTGQLLGTSVNLGILNRNAFREAIQTVTNARFGIEIGTQLIQTLQASLAHKISFPRFIAPFRINQDRVVAPRTFLNLNAVYTDRRDFFTVQSFNAAWGYDWIQRRRGDETRRSRITWQYIPLNFEYTSVQKTDSLLELERRIPSYKFAFNDGMIISQILNMTTARERANKLSVLRGQLEESGALFGLIKKLELASLRRYIKLTGEYKYYINNSRSSWAFRAMGGYGFVYGKIDTGQIVKENTLPFFKAFFAGGPNSMRAWQVRRLGPGTSNLYNPKDTTSIDRFGNMQLEFNAEYRFNITTIAGVKVNSALFTDIGNIWGKEFVPNTNIRVQDASFRFNHLFQDLAIGAGTSLRLDFGFFLIRLDWAYKIKDPLYAHINGGWFHDLQLLDGQFQLGIGYPF